MNALFNVLQGEGFYLLAFGAFIAGLVRGFSGFGTAMVYLPIAAQVLTPFQALTTMIVMDLVGPLAHIPRALRDGQPRDVLRLGFGALLTVPLGVLVLGVIAPEVFRYGVSVISITLLVLLVSGVRYRGALTKAMIYITGMISGFLTGSVGLPGPPVIMLYMASDHPAKVVRANTMFFLLLADIIMFGVMYWNGYLVAAAVLTGAVLVLPYLVAIQIGSWMFRPRFERAYRITAYMVIGFSAITGLPLFD